MITLNNNSTVEKEATVTIFPPLPKSSCGGSSCSCKPSINSVSSKTNSLEEFTKQLHKIQEQNKNRFRIEVAQYDTVPGIHSTIKRLNEIFESSGMKFMVTQENLVGILLSYAPIIAVNNQIMTTGTFSETGHLIEYLKTIFLRNA